MNHSASPLLQAILDARLPLDAFAASSGWAAAPGGLADDELVAATAELESLGRLVDGLRLVVAGEVAARSASELGGEGLSRSQNFATPAKYLAAITGVSAATARSRLELASRVHTSFTSYGAPNPPMFPRVAGALASGSLGIDAATVITKRLHDVAARTGFTEALEEAEGQLVYHAQQSVGGLRYSANEVDAIAVRACTHLDPDGAEPREADLHDRRYLALTPQPSGMTKLTGCLPPSSAAIVKAALEPFTSPRIVRFDDCPAAGDRLATGASATGATSEPDTCATDATDTRAADASAASAISAACGTFASTATSATGDAATPADPVFADTRTRGQKTADALVQLMSMAAGLPEVPRINGAAPTVNVHATLDDIVAGRGVGWVDGLTEPLPHSTVEALLCRADTITTLFGQHGQVLQHGKTKRLFTTAQNRALAARDGGCVWPGCDAPPSWCESHHVDGWLSESHPGGLTDIDNGALLCHFHHSHVHKTRWKLTMRNGTPHLIPPDSIDWTQTPRPCQQNRARETPAQLRRARKHRPPGTGTGMSPAIRIPPRTGGPHGSVAHGSDAPRSGAPGSSAPGSSAPPRAGTGTDAPPVGHTPLPTHRTSEHAPEADTA